MARPSDAFTENGGRSFAAVEAHNSDPTAHGGGLAPIAHATTHKSGGTDAIKLDELAAPADTTTLNASTSSHGLLRKLDGSTTNFLRGDGTWAAPAGGGMSIGGAITSGTSGSVLYVNSSGQLAQTAGLTFTPGTNQLVVGRSINVGNDGSIYASTLDPASVALPSGTPSGTTIGWNRSAGDGESNIIAMKGAGATGGFRFQDWTGTTLTTLATLSRTGQLLVNRGTSTPAAQLEIGTSSTSTTFGGAVMRIVNTSSIGQNAISFYANTTQANGQIRSAYDGVMYYISRATGHQFLIGGEAGTGTVIANVIPTGFGVTGIAATSGQYNKAFYVSPGAHTTQQASAESSDIYFGLDRNVQWNTGGIALQRAFIVMAPTYRFTGASTITTADTVHISGAPIAGTNATITTANALRVASGDTALDGNLRIGGAAKPASMAGGIAINNGTAPTASIVDGVALYAEDVSASSELRVRDEAGNVTTLSPHNRSLLGPAQSPLAWTYYSERPDLGLAINVDMYEAVRAIEALAKRFGLPNTQFIYTGTVETDTTKRSRAEVGEKAQRAAELAEEARRDEEARKRAAEGTPTNDDAN